MMVSQSGEVFESLCFVGDQLLVEIFLWIYV